MTERGGSPVAEPAPARRGRPRDPSVDEAILAAALDLLAEVGFARLTMDEVAARARVGKASLYLRWPNRVALVSEAIQNRSAVVPAVPDRRPAPGAGGGSRPDGRVLTFSALTVVLSLLCLVLAPFGIYRNAGLAFAIGIGVLLAAALTLTPALLAIFGRAAFWPYTP